MSWMSRTGVRREGAAATPIYKAVENRFQARHGVRALF
jgi:hypothetical protein